MTSNSCSRMMLMHMAMGILGFGIVGFPALANAVQFLGLLGADAMGVAVPHRVRRDVGGAIARVVCC